MIDLPDPEKTKLGYVAIFGGFAMLAFGWAFDASLSPIAFSALGVAMIGVMKLADRKRSHFIERNKPLLFIVISAMLLPSLIGAALTLHTFRDNFATSVAVLVSGVLIASLWHVYYREYAVDFGDRNDHER